MKPRIPTSVALAACAAGVLTLLAACGQKGPLELPARAGAAAPAASVPAGSRR